MSPTLIMNEEYASTGRDMIEGAIFEFGFSDAIVQMWAAFLFELETGNPRSRFPDA